MVDGGGGAFEGCVSTVEQSIGVLYVEVVTAHTPLDAVSTGSTLCVQTGERATCRTCRKLYSRQVAELWRASSRVTCPRGVRVKMGGGGRSGQWRPEWLRQTVDIHGTDVPIIVVAVGIVTTPIDGDTVGPTSGGRVIQGMSSLRLLAAPDHLSLSFSSVSGRLDSIDRSESHRGQTGAGAPVISRPRGQSQPIAGNSSVSVVGCLQQSPTTSLTQRPSVQRVELASDRRRSNLTSVELLRTCNRNIS